MTKKPETKKQSFGSISEVKRYLSNELAARCPKDMMSATLQYRYRKLNDIVAALNDIMPDGADISFDEAISQVGNHNYVTAIATLTYGDEVISAKGHAREPDQLGNMMSPQLTGTASTYAAKYALERLFLLYDALDPDFLGGTVPGKSPFAKANLRDQFKKNLEDNIYNALTEAEINDIAQLNASILNAMKSGTQEDKDAYNALARARHTRLDELRGNKEPLGSEVNT